MSEKLRECPWCKSDNVYAACDCVSVAGGENTWNVICDDCGAMGPDAHSEGEAIRHWNARPPQDSWIPITKDIQPEWEDNVLLWTRHRHDRGAFYVIVGAYDDNLDSWWDSSGDKTYPTYWMPLPNPPAAEGK